MTIQTLPATFAGHNLDIIIIGNERWLGGTQIGTALGYTFSPNTAIRKLYNRHSREFDISDTLVVELPSTGGKQLTRLFSHKGVAKLAMLARTERAVEFRDWAARVLTSPPPQPEPPQPELILAPAWPGGVMGDLAKMFIERRGNKALVRYAKLGLGNAEIGRLLGCVRTNITRRRRMAEALGLLEPPANLAQLRARGARLLEARRGA